MDESINKAIEVHTVIVIFQESFYFSHIVSEYPIGYSELQFPLRSG